MNLKKNLSILTILILATGVLSGCTDPAAKTENPEAPIKLNSTNKKVLSDAKVENNLGNTDTKIVDNKEEVTMPAITYKELSDFKKIEATQAVFETTKGTLVLDLYRDKAPLTTANFLDLIDSGFYDGIIFHRVIPGFMAQVGDPFTKDPSKSQAEWGMGGPTYRIMDEFHPDLKHDSAGILSMANSGPNTGGSQIFITYEATPHLDGKHAVFGKLTEGMDVLVNITGGDKIIKATYR